MAINDLLGDDSAQGTTGGPMDALNAGMVNIPGREEDSEAKETERKLVQELNAEYQAARDFDKEMRKQYMLDRKYAAGKADPAWVSDANLIGSFIDILVSFLYAKNPDVGVRPAARVGNQPDPDSSNFAQTLQLVISKLWRDAKLKRTAKKTVRSVLTVGVGWMKSLMWSETKPNPQVERSMRTAQDELKRLQAQQSELETGYSNEDLDVQVAKIQETIAGLQSKMQPVSRAGMTIDFVRAEDMQVSLDVADIADYKDADWNANRLYVPKKALKSRFERLTDDDCKEAATYYQRQTAGPPDQSTPAGADASADGAFSKSPTGVVVGGQKPVEFVCIIELWDKRDGLVKTFVDGMKRWAVEPYPPPQATSDFYPYQQVILFPVDGERAPQSLPQRLRKLQDEYSQTRSGQRTTRERSVPGVLFNKQKVTPDGAKALATSVNMEYVGIDIEGDEPLQNIIGAKPSANIDARMWDTSAVVSDMERLSGVQEALSQSVQTAKTATEAGIEQSGFASRTGADRDSLEDTFRDLAHYTAETAIQEIKPDVAERIAGMAAFWPYGMDVQDVLTMCEVDIDAGSTGKPNQAADRQSWSIILPQVQQTMMTYRQLQLSDPQMAECVRNLLKETLRRLDDRLDIDQILPPMPPGLPGVPGAPVPGAPVPGAGPALPGAEPGATLPTDLPNPPAETATV